MKIQTGHGTITLTALLAIYSISMVTSLPGLAISPILGDLKNIFKDASNLELQMLESLPSFIIVPFILLAGRLSLRINKKRILIIGLSIFFGCSVIYPFSNSLWLLLVVSALLGVGAGMIIPFSTGLIADNFTKRYRTRQLGIASSITNITLVLATFLAGVLADINWHYAFLVYCLSGISLLFAFKLNSAPPATPQKAKPANDTPVSTNHNWPVALMFLYYFITFIVLTVPFNLSIYMETLKFKDPDISGTYISVFFLAMTIPGLFINNIIGWLRGHRPRFRAFPRERRAGTANHRCYPYRVGVRVYATHHIRQNIHEYGRITRNIRTGTGDGHELYGNYHLPFYSRNFTGNILHGCLLFPVFTQHDTGLHICRVHLS